MNERYLVSGSREDNGETVTGYLAQYPSDRCRIFKTSSGGKKTTHSGMYDVDPETIEPVSVKVIYEKGEFTHSWICPNCKDIITQERFWNDLSPRGREAEILKHYRPKFHDDCGQRLDWSDNNE